MIVAEPGPRDHTGSLFVKTVMACPSVSFLSIFFFFETAIITIYVTKTTTVTPPVVFFTLSSPSFFSAQDIATH